MMNFKKIFFTSLVFTQMVFFSSCEKDNDTQQIFDKTPSERISERQQELKNALVSNPLGWKCVYFTDKEQLGGFTHLFKFTKDNKVIMASDFDANVTPVQSEYDVPLGSMVSLLFTTKNRIHLLSDSNLYPNDDLRGKGYKGDFQFLYISKTDNEIIFKGNRNGVEIKFVKATQQDWDNLLKHPIVEEKLIANPTNALFRKIEFKNGNDVQNVAFEFDVDARFLYLDAVDPSKISVANTGVTYTDKGILFATPVKFANQEYSEFIYDPAIDSFVAKGANNATATIKYTHSPLFLTNDYLEFVPGATKKTLSYFNEDLRFSPSNTIFFISMLNKIKTALPGTAPDVNSIELVTNNNSSGFSYIVYSFVGGAPTVYHIVRIERDDVNKKIRLVSRGWQTATAVVQKPAYLAEIDGILTHPDGLYFKKENFKIKYSNTIYTLTSAVKPFRMTFYDNP